METTRPQRVPAGLALLSGSVLLVGGFLMTLPLLDPDPTLPLDSGTLMVEFAGRYRGFLLLLGLFALVGVGIASGVAVLCRRYRILSPTAMDLAARWGFAAGFLWLLRALFLATVRGPWALRYAGELEPQARKDLLNLLWPLMRQVDWFFQWGGAVCLGLAFLWAGAVLVRWPGALRWCGALQLLCALAVATSLLYVLPVHYPRRFAGPGFPTLGVYLSGLAVFETAALALLASGLVLWFEKGPEDLEE